MSKSAMARTSSCWRQRNFGSGLWKICIGAPVLAARRQHRRPFVFMAFQSVKKSTDSKTLPTSSFFSRHFSSSASPEGSKKGLLSWYLGNLNTCPLLTKSVSTSLIFTLADATAQMITMPKDGSIDAIRMLRMSAYGLLIMGPSQHLWFNNLSRIMPKINLYTTFAKIMMGQVIFGPCINTVFFSYNAALRGESQDEIMARLKRDLIPTLKSGLMYWPICDFLTFTFVPVQLHPLVNSSFAYLWTIYLTYMASLGKVESG